MGPVCRICLDSGPGLETPCACRGSIAFVHRACLLKWRQTSKKFWACQVCKAKYSTSWLGCAAQRLDQIAFPLTLGMVFALALSHDWWLLREVGYALWALQFLVLGLVVFFLPARLGRGQANLARAFSRY